MEDGFIRSVGLGSNLVAPLSLVIDDLGIYFNSQTPSRLEIILQTQSFSEQDLQLAKELKERLIYANIGKYNVGHSDFQIQAGNKKTILVPGQVEDDASIRFGSPLIKSNLELLKQVRSKNPTAYILYKPHPDVLSGNRIGAIAKAQALCYADEIVENVNILNCIQQVDEVHTITSLAGFEALLRNKIVHCYGLPFYSNWGLTVDHIPLARRQRRLNLEQLISATLVYYPQYVDPITRKIINSKTAINILQQRKSQIKDHALQHHWLKKQLTKLKHFYRSLGQPHTLFNNQPPTPNIRAERYSSDQPAIFSLPRMLILSGCKRDKFSAKRRNIAIFSAPSSALIVQSSSLCTTSNTQCALFSTSQ